MKKLNLQTPDLTSENIEEIEQLFPNVITESKDKNGQTVKAVDFDLLRQELAKEIVEGGEERYRLDWPGKKRSILKANTPINKTLRPVKQDSKNFDETENLYIEGDNFEVLKILQESYLNKVKMIYVDPPYNTGKDFIYTDNFKKSKEDYEDELGVTNAEGEKLVKNTDTNGRFHSDWLSMMYERLIVARDLLREDGVIFISIDDNEVHNLRKICDEIFGEANFVNMITIKMSEMKGAKLAHVVKKFPKIKEHLLFYSKNKEKTVLNPLEVNKNSSELKKYLKYYSKRIKNLDSEISSWKIESVNDWSYEKKITNAKSMIYLVTPDQEKDINIPEGSFVSIKNSEGNFNYYYNDSGEFKTVLFLNKYLTTYLGDLWLNISTININKENYEIPTYTNGQKPLNIINNILKSTIINTDDIVMDFFSGSGTTADAVLRYNKNMNKNIKFIMVQMKEEIEVSSGMDSSAKRTAKELIQFLNKINKPPFVNEIGKERIRRAGDKIKQEQLEKLQTELEELQEETQQKQLLKDEDQQAKLQELQEKIEHIKNLDVGFRVFKTDSSNMKDVYYHPAELEQTMLDDLVSNIKDGRTAEDLLAQVMLDLGLTLDLPIAEREIKGNQVFVVQENALVACLDDEIDFAIVDEIAKLKPLKVVFKDASFKDDKDRINVETRFKRLSPETQVSVL
ncbi:MAG: site-specific DNA-methyltransferase [Candidatus Pacebacteria bacterium]|nr:site-specific DNA-methyltransferase [Candidatus Paceibacterota bacterium]